MKLTTALSRALKALPREPEDIATVELARHYAAAIDDCLELEKLSPTQAAALKDAGLGKAAAAVDEDVLKNLGPKLLDALAELGLTPKARNAVVKGGVPDGGSDKITELRSRRERRAASMD